MSSKTSNLEPLPAQYVVCSNCGSFLAFVHLFNGVSLLMIDVSTDHSSKNPIGASLAFLFIVCSILSFISARRLDRLALKILLVFAFCALISSSYVFGENILFLNKECMNAKNCSKIQQVSHSQLAMLGLIELATSIATFVFCYRALRAAHLSSPASQYNYNHLPQESTTSSGSEAGGAKHEYDRGSIASYGTPTEEPNLKEVNDLEAGSRRAMK